MDFEHRLNLAAETYRAQGYQVTLRPGPADLPDFAKDFRIEILARRGDVGVLASAKRSQADLEADRGAPRYAEVVAQHPGWRYDLMILRAENPPIRRDREAREPTDEDIHRALSDVERVLQAGFTQQAFISAWAVLETAMRRRMQADGTEADWGSSPRTMLNELYSDGVVSNSVFRDLERLFQTRNALVHGFTIPPIDARSIEFLVSTARTLLEESRASRKTA